MKSIEKFKEKYLEDWQKELPICKALNEVAEIINSNETALITAMTGSGKTILIPLYLHYITGNLVIVREPTRQTAKNTYNFYKKFYGDKVNVGIKTSEDKIGTLKDVDILFITDGVLSRIIKSIKRKFSIVFDEVHLISAPFELEMGLIRTFIDTDKRIEKVIYLTATISPRKLIKWMEKEDSNIDDIYISEITGHFVKYMMKSITETQIKYDKEIYEFYKDNNFEELKNKQKQRLKLFYIEGITQKVIRKIIKSENPEITMMEWVEKAIESNQRVLVFIPTRKECETYMETINNKYEDVFGKKIAIQVNADIKIENVIDFVEKAKEEDIPAIVFSTVALATSLTIDFNGVFILNEGVDSQYENGFKKTYRRYIDNNTIIQMAGRVGRIPRDNNEIDYVLLITDKNYMYDKFEELIVNELEPPLEKLSPLDIVLESAFVGVDVSRFNVLSKINMNEVEKVMQELKEIGIIQRNGKINLTKFGYISKMIPTEILKFVIGHYLYELKYEAVNEEEKELIKKKLVFIMSVASWGEKSLYHLFLSSKRKHDFYKLFDDYVFRFDYPSMFVVKFFIVQLSLMAQDRANKSTTLGKFAKKYNMNVKLLNNILYNLYKLSEYTISYSEIKTIIKTMTFDDLKEIYVDVLKKVSKYDFDYRIVAFAKHGKYVQMDRYTYSGIADWGFMSGDEVNLFNEINYVYSGYYLCKLGLVVKKDGTKTFLIGSDVNYFPNY